jgi:hypothetical protein
VRRSAISARATLFDSEYISAGQTFYRRDAEGSNRGAAISLGLDEKWRTLGATLTLRDEYSATENWNYLNLYEANVRWKPFAASGICAGPKT